MITSWKRPWTGPLLLVALTVALTSGTDGLAQAAEFRVLNLKDTGKGTLRQAVIDSNRRAGADVIRFADGLTGTIVLSKGPLTLTDDVTIEGPGAGVIWIRGALITKSPRNSAISDLTIANGNLSNSGTLTLTGCVIRDSGFGITNSGVLTVTDCSISDNNAGLTNDGAATLVRCIVSRNHGRLEGPGIANHGTLAVRDSTFSENKSFGYWYYEDRGTWPGWTYVPSWGGGVYNRSASPVTVSGCTFSGNHADWGAAISSAGDMTLVNSTVSGNTGDASGGGPGACAIDTHWSLSVVNCTITGNPGGIYNDGSGNLHIRNTIIAGNTSYDVNAAIAASAYNLIGNPTGGIGFSPTDLLGVDPLLGPLQDNGGATWTHALTTGSPAINAGDPNFNPNGFNPPLVTDQRGSGYNRVVGGRIDIGAFEKQ